MRQLAPASYAVLLDKVQKTLILGQQKIEEAKVRTYWETGQLINQHLERIPGKRQERHRQVVARLSKDLGLGEKVFYRCMRFSESFPYFSARRNMTWAHYRALIAVPDEKKRLALTDQASKEAWSSRDLEIEIRNLLWGERVEKADGQALPLLPVPALGAFFAYKIIKPEIIHSRSNELLIDLGFSTVLELNRVSGGRFAPDTVVTSSKDSKGRYALKIPSPFPLPGGEDKGEGALDAALRTPDDLLYTYKAFIERVIDGDTLKVEIDLGFNIRIRQTLRLRGIDCPEIDTTEGKAAQRFVENALTGLEYITLKSTRTLKEKWGRYLGDVFYTDKTGKQAYLNNHLLEEGDAVRVRE